MQDRRLLCAAVEGLNQLYCVLSSCDDERVSSNKCVTGRRLPTLVKIALLINVFMLDE